MSTKSTDNPLESGCTKPASSVPPGSTFLRCHYPWAAQDANQAALAHDWARRTHTPIALDMTGFVERFREYDFTPNPAGATSEDLYWLWVYQEVDTWFRGFADDCSENRARLAAAISRACPFDGSNAEVSDAGRSPTKSTEGDTRHSLD